MQRCFVEYYIVVSTLVHHVVAHILIAYLYLCACGGCGETQIDLLYWFSGAPGLANATSSHIQIKKSNKSGCKWVLVVPVLLNVHWSCVQRAILMNEISTGCSAPNPIRDFVWVFMFPLSSPWFLIKVWPLQLTPLKLLHCNILFKCSTV